MIENPVNIIECLIDACCLTWQIHQIDSCSLYTDDNQQPPHSDSLLDYVIYRHFYRFNSNRSKLYSLPGTETILNNYRLANERQSNVLTNAVFQFFCLDQHEEIVVNFFRVISENAFCICGGVIDDVPGPDLIVCTWPRPHCLQCFSFLLPP